MTFVNNDVAEVVLRVMLSKKTGIFLISANIEGLVSGNEDSSILLGIVASDISSVGAKHILEMSKPL